MEFKILQAKDAKAYWNLRLMTLRESPDSFLLTMEEELNKAFPIKKISNQLKDPYRTTIGCFMNDTLIGAVTLQREFYLKLQHKGSVLSFFIKEEYRNKGIGRKMLQMIIDMAIEYKLEQLILSVVSTNSKAIGLYESFGFSIYGKEPNSLKWNNRYYDELHMILTLPNNRI